MIDHNLLEQVGTLFQGLESHYIFRITYHSSFAEAAELIEFLSEVSSCSEKIVCETILSEDFILQFSLIKQGKETGIIFRGIPSGHEFSSLILAVLNADGKGKNLPDAAIIRRIESLKGSIHIQSFISLSCTNCPDIVQALNVLALINPHLTHEIVDGTLFESEVTALKIQAVPTVYANGELLHVGRGSLGELLQKLEERFAQADLSKQKEPEKAFDVIVLGGGPAGASAAVYSARKGLKVAVIAKRIGGQVKETVAIENLIATPHTTGAVLADQLRTHMNEYDISLFEEREIVNLSIDGNHKRVAVAGGERFKAPSLILATGASWRKLNVPGEEEYIGRGVAFCPHCDGPFYAGKDVAVIGGGNSGVEAAIDLAGICRKVILFEFAGNLRADQVLQEKARSLSNVTIHTSSQTMQVLGDGEKVTSIAVKNRETDKVEELPLDGIFVQIGLSPNSSPFREVVETKENGEIVIDASCRTSQPGIYAAGDVSTVPYKQIVIAMGEGAKAALSAFDDRIRGNYSV